MSDDEIRQIVCRDLDADFIEAVAVRLAWEYEALYERISEWAGLPVSLQGEEFRRARSFCAMRALALGCEKHGVPFEARRLPCNGQEKLLVKAGRVIIIQEPVLGHDDGPAISNYKIDLAAMHGFVRQLELPLGDYWQRTTDWSGCVLAVLLHGPVGEGFSRSSAALQNIQLGIPDAAYRQWVHRLDLHDLAMFGRVSTPAKALPEDHRSDQEDRVVVTTKRKSSQKKTA